MIKKFTFSTLLFLFSFSALIAQNQSNCSASFSTNNTGNTVRFSPAILGDSLALHFWLFGDGTSSNLKDPSHTYSVCGTYTITHIFKTRNPNGVVTCGDTVFQSVSIVCPTPCNTHASFIDSAVNATNATHYFYNTSTATPGVATYSIWNFGDGSPVVNSSGLTNQSHTYTTSGTYNVCLKVISAPTSGSTTCADSVCHTIQVQVPAPNPCNLVPRVSIQNQNNVYSFTNTSSTVASSISWSFGDSTTGSGNSVTHTYNHAGTYQVCMHVATSNTCIRDTCFNINVTIPTPNTCAVNAGFRWQTSPTTSTTNNNYTIYFLNTTTSLSLRDSIIWNFGDGTSSHQLNPIHNFSSTNGRDTVCLTVIHKDSFNNAICTSQICKVISFPNLIAFPNPAQTSVSFSVNLQQPTPIYAFIYNMQNVLVGQVLQQGVSGSNIVTFNVAGLATGYYYIRVYYNGSVHYTRFFKQ